MKRQSKMISCVLMSCMVITLFSGVMPPAHAASADMDALTALGIDTSVAPEGFDANSSDNPYGRDTIEVSPVYELYTVGLESPISFKEQVNAENTGEVQNGGSTFDSEQKTNSNQRLKSNLYGNEAWTAKNTDDIMSSSKETTIASGETYATGVYEKITYGEHDVSAESFTNKGYLTGAKNVKTNLNNDLSYALSTVAAGNFDGNKSGLSEQTVMIYTGEYSANGGLYLKVGSTKGTYGSSSMTLLNTNKMIGNPELKYEGEPVENFAKNPYQMQNYLQVATGDWNADGIDEIAVYIPEVGNSRIVVYALQVNQSDLENGLVKESSYQQTAKWTVAWTYYLRETDVVSNMVSLTSGDVNKDGIDDLAATWGFYYGPTQNIGSTAVVMFGAKGTSLLKKAQQFNLVDNETGIELVRASFAFGDLSGSGDDTLILTGQSNSDIKNNNMNTRYVALYSWNGNEFTSNVYKNFDIFDRDEDGNYIYPVGTSHGAKGAETFYSLPLCVSNTAIITQGMEAEGGDQLYFDSLLVEYTDSGLNIKMVMDTGKYMQSNTKALKQYVEYGAVAGDMTGQTGAATFATMQQTMSESSEGSANYTLKGEHKEPTFSWHYYYENWLFKLLGIKSRYLELSGWKTVTEKSTIPVKYSKYTAGDAYMVVIDTANDYNKRAETDFSMALCLANTDNDSSYMSYGGAHYFTYSDPEVLAVLASPPYFADLLNRDDLSGNYSESTTSYSSTTGSASGVTGNATITAGAYVAFEQDIKVFGVTVASVEAEAVMTAGFTWETEETSTLEQTVTYSATAGEDMVAFYSIPLEVYEYTSYVPDGEGGYDKVLTTVNLPHEAAVRLLSLEEYEAIAADYSVLPTIADSVLNHEIGNPTTYPSNEAGYKVIAQYEGDPSSVGYSSTGGGAGISQEIQMSTEKSNAYTGTASIETKAGAGAGGFKVGVVAGVEGGGGTVTVSTSGNSFSGDMQNMPIEAKPYGYAMNWKIFCYKYNDGKSEFPVVSYLVSDVTVPAPLPGDFEQNISETTDDSITLTWTYDRLVSGFQLYRYYEFPDGSGSAELEFVPFANAVDYDKTTGVYTFSYTDSGLSPYTDYTYQIQTVSSARASKSIYSEPMVCRTKTEVGYPDIELTGLVDGVLPIYPDDDSTVVANILDKSQYNTISYQWQRLSGSEWVNISGEDTDSLTISNAGAADAVDYRCRINVVYYDENTATEYYISAYTDTVTTAYSKRTPTYTEDTGFTADVDAYGKLTSEIELYSANRGHGAAPTGTVTFTIKGQDYQTSHTVALDVSDSTKMLGDQERYYSTATFELPNLPTGVYRVSAYYGGSRIFKDLNVDEIVVISGNATSYQMNLYEGDTTTSSTTNFTYGESIVPKLTEISKSNAGILTETPISTGVTYFLVTTENGQEKETEINIEELSTGVYGFKTGNVGNYTIIAKYQPLIGENAEVAELNYVVAPRDVTITAETFDNVPQSQVVDTVPTFKSEEMTEEELAELKLDYIATNSAGNKVTLSADTNPGNYTIISCPSVDTDLTKYGNYNITFVPGTYTIIGTTYTLTVSAKDYSDASGSRPVGNVMISDTGLTEGAYPSGTEVSLTAACFEGYQVDTWTATFNDNVKVTQEGKNTFRLTTQAQEVDVVATFKPIQLKLVTSASPVNGGTIECTDPSFNSGAIVSTGAQFEFTAIPEDGYHFTRWQQLIGGLPSIPVGTQNEDGSNTVKLSVGTASSTLYAMFERDSYNVELDGDISAYYLYDHDGVAGTPLVEHEVVSGDSVKGDTEITVSPKSGYSSVDGAVYYVNDEATSIEGSSKYVFTIGEDTKISLETKQNGYPITTSAENGTIKVNINEAEATGEDLTEIAGGSKVEFIPIADRGYVFDHWVVNEQKIDNGTEEAYVINALAANQDVKAVFKANTEYTATGETSPATRGKIHYTLKDIYGEVVAEDALLEENQNLVIYEGESILFTVKPTAGSMIEQWNINHLVRPVLDTTYNVDSIDGNIDIIVFMTATSKYNVYYWAADSTGAENDTEGTLTSNVSSGELLSGGSKLEFNATPENGKMVDYWTVTVGGPLVSENTDQLVDADGVSVVDPIYTIPYLTGHYTVRAHFTDKETNEISVSSDNAAGLSKITYVTPIEPTDNGERDTLSDTVRSGGTAIMTFEPADGYITSAKVIEDAIKADDTDAAVKVVKAGDVYTATAKNITNPIALSIDDIYTAVYNITVPKNVISSHNIAEAGEKITLTVTPETNYELQTLTVANSTDASQIVTLNEEVNKSTLVYTFDMPAYALNVTAEFKLKKSDYNPGGGGGGGGGAEPAPVDPEITIPVTENGKTVQISAKVEDGLATLNADGKDIDNILDKNGNITIDAKKLDADSIQISDSFVNTLADSENTELTIQSKNGSVTLDNKVLNQLSESNGDLVITISPVDVSNLPKNQKEMVGDRPVYELKVSVGGKPVSNFNGNIKVTLPYKLKDNEKADAVKVWFLDDEGQLTVISRSYDPETSEATFNANHFSSYVIGYFPFEDVADDHWAYSGVAHAYLNGLFSGTGDAEFSPESQMTRAMLMTVLARLDGQDTTGGSVWYEKGMEWAKAEGISDGSNPEGYITREQLATMLNRYIGSTDNTGSIDQFSDSSKVSSYAVDAMCWAVKNGLITGMDDGTLNPQGDATRAQVAVILMRFCEKTEK